MSTIDLDRQGAVAVITINRPDVMNSLDFAANDELIEAWEEFDTDDSLRVAVITGAGTAAFCAGADLKTYSRQFATRPAPEYRRDYTNGRGFGGITRGMEIDKPIVAAVNGYAISGGLELALAADIRIAATNAEFALQDAQWGFHACDGGLIRLPQIVGLGNAMEIVLGAERISAQHALRMGLVNQVVEPGDLLTVSVDYAKKLATRGPLAHRFAKEVMRRAVGMPMAEALRLESRSFYDLGGTHDMAEGNLAFREGRQARFESR